MRVAVLAAALWLVPTPSPRSGAGPSAAYDDMAVELLRRYLRIDTTNPPGNELKGALFFRDVFEAEGISVEVDEFAPGRANLLAVVTGNGRKRPLILMNHMDVVPAEPEGWSVPPFSGLTRNGAIYGRGAEDMKTEGILQAVALLRAKREKLSLDRDLLFLATADEEEGFKGALRALTPQGFSDRLSRAEYLLSEGGENVVASGRPLYFGVATAEKGVYRLTLRASGTPGHAAQPIAESAPNRLVRALDRIRRYQPPTKLLPIVESFLRGQAGRVARPRSDWYRDLKKALANPATVRILEQDKDVWSLLHNTISITMIKAGYKTNVIPASAEAELDVRLLPGEDPHEFVAALRQVIGDPSIEITAPHGFRSPKESATGTEAYRAIERVVERRHPGVPVLPKLLTGATESVLFRPLGIHCYGFTSLLATVAELETGHGRDELVSEASVRQATGFFYDVVREIAEGKYPFAEVRSATQSDEAPRSPGATSAAYPGGTQTRSNQARRDASLLECDRIPGMGY